jgi:hypothetical protein
VAASITRSVTTSSMEPSLLLLPELLVDRLLPGQRLGRLCPL